MFPLQTRATISGSIQQPILKVLTLEEFVRTKRNPADCALWFDGSAALYSSRAIEDVAWGAVFCPATQQPQLRAIPGQCVVSEPRAARVISPGDVIRVNHHSHLVSVLYRRGSRNNSLLVTERCNSYCIMCSQPPIERDDSARVDELLRVIPLVDLDEPVLGITGGEPTLLGKDLVRLLAAARAELPDTRLHILTNGRRFNESDFTRQVAAVEHPAVQWAIPLYSDCPEIHDYVVQRRGAFSETLSGLLNLARNEQRIELRVVLQQATVPRLRQLAHFIVRNLTFVDHVAWMGLEPMGFARPNWKDIWIEPEDYVSPLADAIARLNDVRIATSIYNVPLCVLPERLRAFAAQSISDWKNSYLEECETCSLRGQCCGFFSSVSRKYLPRNIHPIVSERQVSGVAHG